MKVRTSIAAIVVLVASGCSTCGENSGGPGAKASDAPGDARAPDGNGETTTDLVDSSPSDSSRVVDGAGDGGGSAKDGDGISDADGQPSDGNADGLADGTRQCSAGEAECGGNCVDRRRNRDHCGSCGDQCSGREVCTDGKCMCPRYHEQCGGTCIATHIDPDNCGRCGRPCGPSEVCSAGTCADSCLSGRVNCGRRCVDRGTNSDHCGSCGHECDDGEACLAGSCEPAVEVGEAPDKCVGGGPQIGIEVRPSERERCLGNVAEGVFRWAVCACDRLTVDDLVETDAYDSTLGRYRPGGLGGSVGTNGDIEVNNDLEVHGAVWASDQKGAHFDNKVDIHQQLHVGGTVEFADDSRVRRDGFVEGDVVADDVRFQQTLHVNSRSAIRGQVSHGGLDRTNVEVPEACERCGKTDRIPVGDIVKAHKGSNNDNAAIGLDADALKSRTDASVLELPCGEYYLSEITSGEKVTIVADGRTALYVNGDLRVGNDLAIKPTATGELDIFVAGQVYLDNMGQIGDPAYPASTRLYVGGDQGVKLQDNARLGAYVYSVPGGITADDNLSVYGGIYAQFVQAGNDLRIHYDRAVLDAGKNCTPIDPNPPTPNLDAGTGDSGGDGGGSDADTSDGDGGGMDADTSEADGGGSTPACVDSGEPCMSDGDCCAPLVCGAADTCDVKECRERHESCSEDSDCCSRNCAPVGEDSVCVGF